MSRSPLLPPLPALPTARQVCEACRRPPGLCYCAHLPQLSPRTKVVILQHPRERGNAIGTAHMARLCLPGAALDLSAFRKRFAMAIAGMIDDGDARWRDALVVAERVPDDMLAPFLMIAHAALTNAPCPPDNAIARAYGTSSPGRVRRLIEHMEKSGLVVIRTDFGGRRSIGLPDLGLSTAPAEG